ncbi:AMP-binding protein [Enterovirga rhinocerotis]|uniref:AMP-binding protein n=1 Tax=Enterovirga rhinocerotis TaxID=1339210 RepID=UPI001FE0F623|nr:AMP-binding protein [Enterovirga rhinocerotis]
MPAAQDHAALAAGFRWALPRRYNMGVDVADRWGAADPERAAVIEVRADDSVDILTFGALQERSNRLANVLASRGVRAGDRVAILLKQGVNVPVAHCAAYKLGAIALPLASVFGRDGLLYRLMDSGAKALITGEEGLAKIVGIRAILPELETILSIHGSDSGAEGLVDAMARAPAEFTPVDTRPDDPALMIYTSGTTGQPKGALHGHRVLLGHLPGIVFPHGLFPHPGDRFWTPADWAWAGGLLNCLLPSLRYGVPVIARKDDKFDPEAAFRLMAKHEIRNAFIPPTALRMLRAVPNPRERFGFALRSVCSAGEQLGAETAAWGEEALGLPIDEAYGQTECNLVIGTASAMGVLKPGATGKPIPGHKVGIVRADGTECEPGELGQIAVRRPDPVMFLGYWRNPEATAAKFIDDWMITGDQATRDEEGYISFVGRDDDVITSAGYRIGPGEIEDCLIRHPAVALAAAIGKPDALRTEIVKAFIVPKAGFEPSEQLAADIQAFVRNRLSAHEYPREIAFRNGLPMTTTGKVIRRILRDEP